MKTEEHYKYSLKEFNEDKEIGLFNKRYSIILLFKLLEGREIETDIYEDIIKDTNGKDVLFDLFVIIPEDCQRSIKTKKILMDYLNKLNCFTPSVLKRVLEFYVQSSALKKHLLDLILIRQQQLNESVVI